MKRIGLIGLHLGHSYSKIVHEAIRDCNYEMLEMTEEEVDAFLKAKNFDGLNVTIPYKQFVIPYLDEINECASSIGAVNTIVKRDGKLIGYNTDYYGLEYTFNKHHIAIKDKVCAILGTGGTSKTGTAVLNDLGAKKIYYVSRNKHENDDILTYDELKDHPEINVILNATPSGMFPNFGKSLVDFSYHKNMDAVVDVIFNPLRTGLLLEAADNGIKAYNGLDMLVEQAIISNELFYGDSLDHRVRDKVIKMLSLETHNIILIGMPASGKSVIGRKLSTLSGREFIDTDELIEKKTNMKISDIFSTFGEEYFRNIENEVVKEISLKKKLIISTGGGIIKNPTNMDLLRANGVIVFLRRPAEKIIINDDRPLLKSKKDFEDLYKERYPLYMKYHDVLLDNNKTIEDAVLKIKEKLL